jgi:hypothetical protein
MIRRLGLDKEAEDGRAPTADEDVVDEHDTGHGDR